MRTGFIGLGSQGAPMARRLLDDRHHLAIWARRPASTEPFADTTAVIVSSPAQVGAASDVVGVCVVDDSGVEEVVAGEHGVLTGMTPGGVVLVHSTIHPETCRRLAELARAQGVSLLDAPVSGGGLAAAERRLLVMVGGDAQVVERVHPVLEAYGDPVLHLGPLGAGQMAKLLNNLVFTAQLGLATETFSLAAAFGMDPSAVAQVLGHGSGGSRAADILAMSTFHASALSGAAGLLEKDVGIVTDVAEASGVIVPDRLSDLARRALALMSDSSS
jgi:3-hydroxyisobutyrate dehydrogenase-like beta-hydroxyacid dehydrogenase